MVSKQGEITSHCANAPNGVSVCNTPAAVSAGNSAKNLGLVSSVGWATAIAGVGVGAVIWFTVDVPVVPMQTGGWTRAGVLSASATGATFGIEGGF